MVVKVEESRSAKGSISERVEIELSAGSRRIAGPSP
jgi:hypothetical protein